MKITEVKITRVNGDEKLKAFVSITFDDSFVVRDLKIIKGQKGEFVAMPSRKQTVRCSKCGRKNNLHSNFCNNCGIKLSYVKDENRQNKVYADIAHPINAECRSMIQHDVLEAYRQMPEEKNDSSGQQNVDKDETNEAISTGIDLYDETDDFSEGIW